MSKGNTTETDILAYAFNATAFSWNAVTNLYVALHTADPGEAGDQTTSESAYTGYARVAVARTAGGWTVAGNNVVNAGLVQFGQCSAGTSAVTHASVGTAASGAGQILWSGALSATLNVAAGIQPQFSAGTLSITED